MSELKPCPFCGGDADEYEGDYGNGIYCMMCGAMVGEPIHLEYRTTKRASIDEAIDAWNTRAYDEAWLDALPMTEENMREYGWVRERTCQVVRSETCGKMWVWCHEFSCDCGQRNLFIASWQPPKFCPNCGAKVVEE